MLHPLRALTGVRSPLHQRRRDTPAFDPDALAYITAVETADGEALEAGVREAINDFVVGCKADGIWDALQASCILAGARTLNGALVPLVGDAPTNFNFVTDDYDRVTGLKGDGSTKYLDSNRANNADPQDNNHLAAFSSALGATNANILASGIGLGRRRILLMSVGQLSFNANGDDVLRGEDPNVNALMGASRHSENNTDTIVNGLVVSTSQASAAPSSARILLYTRPPALGFSSARLSFYSIGEALDLATLDSRVSALMTALDGAI